MSADLAEYGMIRHTMDINMAAFVVNPTIELPSFDPTRDLGN